MSVGVLSPVTGGFFYGDVLQGLVRAVSEVGGHVTVVQTLEPGRFGGRFPLPPEVDATLGIAHIDGFVSVSPAAGAAQLRRLQATGRPVVVASQAVDGVDAASVVPDNVESMRAATLHLVDHGHTRIAFFGDLSRSDMRERHAGYLAALAERGLEADPAHVFDTLDTVDPPLEAEALPVVAAVRAPGGPTALVCATDRSAVGLLTVLPAHDVRIPEDLAVVGFDDIESGWYSTPALSTVHQSMDGIGVLAAQLVLAELRGEPVEHRAHAVPARFVVRRSCGCTGTDTGTDLHARLDETAGHAVTTGPAEDERAGLGLGRDTDVASLDRVRAEALRLVPTEPGSAVLDEATLLELERVLDAQLERLYPSVPPPETVRRLAATLVHGLWGATVSPDADAATLRAALEQRAVLTATLVSRMQATHGLRLARVMSTALREQYLVAMGLVGGTDADPRDLAWLGAVGVRLGCLGLWDDDGHLRVTGTYDPAGVLPGPDPAVCPPEEFPPRAFVEAADASRAEAAFVIPVAGPHGDHGFLALVAPVDAELETGLVTFGHWAALLAVALRQRELLDEVRRSEERYSLASLATNDGLWDWDVDARSCFWSGRSREMLAMPGPDEAEAQRQTAPRAGPAPAATGDALDALDPWLRRVHPDDVDALRDRLRGVLDAHTPLEVEHRVLSPTDEYRWTLCRAVPVGARGRAGRVVGSLADVHPRRLLEEQLRHAALHDALTDLPNRRLFLTRVEEAVAEAARPGGTGFAVLFLDLDDFKAVNDSLGHPAGDELLQVVGQRLLHSLRPHDVAARFGGDEFAVLLPGIQDGAVRPVLERLRGLVTTPVQIGTHLVRVAASIGVTTSALRYASAEEVLRDADAAMYRAKATGREATSWLPAEGPVR